MPYGRYKDPNYKRKAEPPAEPVRELRKRLANAAAAALSASDWEAHRDLLAIVSRLDELVVHLPAAVAVTFGELRSDLETLKSMIGPSA
jgi:hypothetical protein